MIVGKRHPLHDGLALDEEPGKLILHVRRETARGLPHQEALKNKGGASQKLRSRRDLTVKTFNSIPRMSCVSPRGAFYAFPRLEIPEGDDVFVKELLFEKQVLVVHGSGFGQRPGSKHFRVVFLPNEETLSKAYSAIGDLMQKKYS